MKTGDKVVCITSHGSAIEGKVYEVYGIKTLACGCVVINVGLTLPHVYFACFSHGCFDNPTGGYQWHNSDYFKPIQYNSAHDELLEIIEEKIDIPEKQLS
jgi:hypothetical protein